MVVMVVAHDHGAAVTDGVMAQMRTTSRTMGRMMGRVMAMNGVVAMVRVGRGDGGRCGERDGDSKRQADEFQGRFSQFLRSPIRHSDTGRRGRPDKCRQVGFSTPVT